MLKLTFAWEDTNTQKHTHTDADTNTDADADTDTHTHTDAHAYFFYMYTVGSYHMDPKQGNPKAPKPHVLKVKTS